MKIFKRLLIFILIITAVNLSVSQEFDRLPVITKHSREYISLYDITKLTGIDNIFDVVNQKGKLFRKDHYAVYQIGYSVIIIDGKLYKSDYSITRYNGDVLIPTDLFLVISSVFLPEKNFIKQKDFIVSSTRTKPAVPDVIIPEKEDPVVIKDDKPGKEKITFIVIDAGHGGKDPGALGRGKIMEKTITLKLALGLEKYLRGKLPGKKIVLTRKSDVFIELGNRTEIANRLLKKNENGLFVSIHINASMFKEVNGYETYFLSQNPTNNEARATATLENNVTVFENKDSRKYDDLDYIEALMINTQIQTESSHLAHIIQENMKKRMTSFPSKGVRKADFFVLRGVLMPAVLVEAGYISNPKEAKMLLTDQYQKKIIESVGTGIVQFINDYNTIIKK